MTTSTTTSCCVSTSAAISLSAPASVVGSAVSASKSHWRRSRSCERASRATMVESCAFFWISARVWRTESCRCAAMSARSWVRTRSARSAPRSLHQAQPPRADDDREAEQAEQPGDEHGHGERRLPGGHREDDHRGDDQSETGGDAGVRRPAAVAEDRAERVDAPGGVDPALALRLVGLAPQQRDPGDAEDDRPEQRALAEDPLDAEHDTEEQRTEGDRRARRRAAASGGAAACRSAWRSPGRVRPPRRTGRRAGTSTGRRRASGRSRRGTAVATKNPRTHSTGTARWVARPEATPPAMGAEMSR